MSRIYERELRALLQEPIGMLNAPSVSLHHCLQAGTDHGIGRSHYVSQV